jgi:thiol-disulfide isomerase/thioredoxin
MKIKRGLLGLVILAVVLTACSAPTAKSAAMMDKATPTPEAMMSQETPTADTMMGMATPTPEAMMSQETPTADTMMGMATPTPEAMMGQEMPTADTMMSQATPTPDAMMDQGMSAPAWFDAKLTDINTGQSFKVADWHGKVILVETMAVWCPTCLQQQQQVQALNRMLGMRDDLALLALDIDPNENDSILKTYANAQGFDWKYAVAPADVAREIGNLYGSQFLNPPSAPMFIIDRQGQVHTLQFGVKSAQDLETALEPFLTQQ